MTDCTKNFETIRPIGFAIRFKTVDAEFTKVVLSHPELQACFEGKNLNFRTREFPPYVTTHLFMRQVIDKNLSCQAVVNRHNATLTKAGETNVSRSTGAYCKARRRIDTDWISSIVRKTGEILSDKAHNEGYHKHRRILSFDGFCLTMPDAQENQKEYPQPSSQEPGVGFPMARLVAVSDLFTGGMLDLSMASYSGKGTGEVTQIRTLISHLLT